MRKVGRCLFCCDNNEELQTLKNTCTSDYIVATNQYWFYKEINITEERVIFLESDEINPYETVWNVLDQIHEVIDNSSKYEYSRLFHFSYNLEGGFPVKIARMVININLIHKVVQNYGIEEIHVFDNKENWVINESLFLYARSRKIKCHIWDREQKKIKRCLKTLETMGMATQDMKNNKIFLEEKQRIDCIKRKSVKKIQNNIVECEEIGILYCCRQPYDKHVDWLLRRISAIGGNVRVICYYDTEDIKKFLGKGLRADCLENYISIESFETNYLKLKNERKRVLSEMADKLNVLHLDVNLSPWLIVKIRNCYYRELIDYLYMNICAQNYFLKHKFKYIHIWGNTCFWETWICYDNTRDNNTKLFKIDSVGFNLYKTKQPYQNMLSVIYAPTEYAIHSQFTEKYLGKICFINDVFWGEISDDAACPKRIGEKKRIAILPTGVINGFTTYHFYYNTLFPLIDMLLSNGYEVIFKNHPGMTDCWEEDVKQKFISNEKFTVLEPYTRINDVLVQCDMVITDISSAAMDAAVAQKAVFCIVDNQGYRLISQNKEGFSIYQDTTLMLEDIKQVLNNDDEYKKIIEKQNRYMSELTGNKNINMNGRIRSFLYSINEKEEDKKC